MARTPIEEATPVLLSLGSNLGDRLTYIESAIELLTAKGSVISLICSPIYETEPVGYLDQPPFLNCCVTGVTSHDPLSLYWTLKQIEQHLGRAPRPRWHEREIDLDIILYGNQIIEHSDVVIPHPRALERAFVLIPAADIAPEWIHPVAQQTIAALAQAIKSTSVRKTDFRIRCDMLPNRSS